MQDLLGVVQLLIWIITVVAFYFKMRNDINLSSTNMKADNKATRLLINLANERIDKIEQDRKFRWKNYSIEQKEQNKKLTEISVGIAKIQNDISWIRENN